MSGRVELEVRDLTKRYSPLVSVGPISFEVHEGEFFSLLGPSGCGKTTTLRCIAGFEALSGGAGRGGGGGPARQPPPPPPGRPPLPTLPLLPPPTPVVYHAFSV